MNVMYWIIGWEMKSESKISFQSFIHITNLIQNLVSKLPHSVHFLYLIEFQSIFNVSFGTNEDMLLGWAFGNVMKCKELVIL